MPGRCRNFEAGRPYQSRTDAGAAAVSGRLDGLEIDGAERRSGWSAPRVLRDGARRRGRSRRQRTGDRHRAHRRADRGRRRARRSGLAGGAGHRHLVGDQPRRFDPGASRAGKRRLDGLRRRVPLRRLPLRRPRAAGGLLPARRPRPDRRRQDQRLRRHHPRPARRRQGGADVPRQREWRPVRRHLERRLRRGQLSRLLLGVGRQEDRPRLAARDADPLLVDPLRRRQPGEMGHHALPQPAARVPLPVLHLQAAARPQLLHLQRARAAWARRAADRQPLGRAPYVSASQLDR
jgi:hypothetical protein